MFALPSRRVRFAAGLLSLGFALNAMAAGVLLPLHPKVELEEDVYSYQPAENGAGPLWCAGSTSLGRIGNDLFASGLETLPGVPPLNNCRWLLFHRGEQGWQLQQADPIDRSREPSPLAVFPDGRVFLSVNPTLRTNREAGGGPAQPRLLQFAAGSPRASFQTYLPLWSGRPKFTEHSYRSLAADGVNRELILFQNVDSSHAEWTFFDRTGQWSAQGQLVWPWGAEYDKPQPIRVCYPNVALKNRAVHFCGVSDIHEPYQNWFEFKRQLTGNEWDYDFRRLFYAWTPDIRTGKFSDWVEISSRDKTCGWITPGDLWVAPDDAVHIIWIERAIDPRLRDKFFPEARQSHALNYAILRQGKVVLRRALAEAREGGAQEIPSAARFHVSSDHRLLVFYCVQGTDSSAKPISENRVFELLGDGSATEPVRVPLKSPFTGLFTATVRAGSATSDVLEILGEQRSAPRTLRYARVRLW